MSRTVGRDDGNGVLYFEYEWESESGNINDFLNQGLLIGEIVEYSGEGQNLTCQGQPCFCPFSPPYSGECVNNPYIEDQLLVGVGLPDEQKVYSSFVMPYQANVFYGEQHYRFRDPLLMSESEYETLLGPFFIRRNVFLDNAVWKYRIEKDGVSAELILP
jgi:hypothetical protein